MKTKLTEAQWSHVFDLRCRGKRGEHLSPEDQKLLQKALREDLDRYEKIGDDAFDATVPFGSTAKARRRP